MRDLFQFAFKKYNGGDIKAVEVGVFRAEHAYDVLSEWPHVEFWLVDDFRELPEAAEFARVRVIGYPVHWAEG
jgi:hypothetical protein